MKIDTTKLRVEMAKKNINQKHLAALSGIQCATLSLIMREKSNGRPETWSKISKALGVSVAELIED